MDEDRPKTSSFSFSRFGRRLDQRKTTGTRFYPQNVVAVPPIKLEKKATQKGDWLFRRIDRSQGSIYSQQQQVTQAERDYKPHFDIIEKHIPTISFEKQTKRRSMSLSNNQQDISNVKIPPPKVKMMIPFDKQEGRKDVQRDTVDKFYQPMDQMKNNNAHSFESYSARKPLVEKDAMPDYEIQKSFNYIKSRRQTAVDFGKSSQQKEHLPITCLLDYDVKSGQKIRTIQFNKQIPREKKPQNEMFIKLFQRLQAKVN
ncbi:unnamed protein product [Paramecium octaurelia]|uniref:Uncharacterized protein n=1 Tax=Paramecium octaurelia TaxID=43137 RepID=A0A8S1VFT0_PAROT|nr:unnamed protein product [Paramecium octaurelia]